MWMPDSGDVIQIHKELVDLFNKEDDPISPSGIRSFDLLESACSRPNIGIGTNYKYKNLEQKLSALFHSLTKNHPFHNGNKRTALVTLLTVLSRNNLRLSEEVSDEEIFDFVIAVTEDNFPKPKHDLDTDQVVENISKWIKTKSISNSTSISGMKVSYIIKQCKSLGVTCKPSKGGAIVLINKDKSIKISKSTKQLDGQVVKNYLKELNLSEYNIGISIDEFQVGSSTERAQIYRFIATLKRLAKT